MCATITILVNLWRTSCEHPNIDMHTNPCANMETHWPVHLKRDTRPTHFEREAGQYGPSVSRPIRSEMRRPRFAGTLRACKCTLSAGRSEREYMTESCPVLVGSCLEVFLTMLEVLAGLDSCIQRSTAITSMTAFNHPPSISDAFPHHTSDIMTNKKPFLPGF